MGAVVAGMIITFGILWLILIYLVIDKILQDLKRRKKERKRRKKDD